MSRFSAQLKSPTKVTNIVTGKDCKKCKRKTVHTVTVTNEVDVFWRCNRCGKKTKIKEELK